MSAPRLRATPLPGIGVQYDLITREDRHLSVVAHRDGARTVSVYRARVLEKLGLSNNSELTVYAIRNGLV